MKKMFEAIMELLITILIAIALIYTGIKVGEAEYDITQLKKRVEVLENRLPGNIRDD